MNIEYKVMTASDYDGVYELWMNTPGMGINSTDDSREGVEKYIKRNPTTSFVALLAFKKNELGNSFWDKMEFIVREDVYYRNKSIHELEYRANPYRNE